MEIHSFIRAAEQQTGERKPLTHPTSQGYADQIVKRRSRRLQVILALQANQERTCVEEPETKMAEILGEYLLSSCPRRQRSKRIINCKNEKKERWQCIPARPRNRRKRRRKEKGNEIDELEVVHPSLGRERSKRRLNCINGITSEHGKLDTNTFELCLENLWRSLPDEKRNSFTYLDCLWFSLYMKASSKAKVLKWIKKKLIFSQKYVFVPIIRWDHWSLLIFCHFGENLESKTSTPCMLLLDSLHLTNPKRLEPGIRKFVLDLYKSEDRPENKKQIYRIPLKVPKVPQQRNGEECGLFVLYYITLFMENAPANFSISEGYPYFMKDDWFTRESLDDFCRRLDSFCQ